MGKLTKIPGLCDVHVHFRQPGFEYKETIRTGSLAAAHGGFTAVCTMPNLKPVPDSRSHLQLQLNAIGKDAVIHVYPMGSITKEEAGTVLSDMEDLKEAIAFSDDGRGVQSAELMEAAMRKAKTLHKRIAAHCEDESLPDPGDRETAEVVRNIALAEKTGCGLHICHVSRKASIEAIRKAKAKGIDVSCESAPQYLLLNDSAVYDDGCFRVNPPIGSAEDQAALIEAMQDGTLDMIVTDHAPHSREEKSRGYRESSSGAVGLEISFPLLYTGFVKTGIIRMERLLDLMIFAPRKRFGIPLDPGDYALWDLEEEYEIDPEEFLSMGRATPFRGRMVFGRCIKTVCGGKTVYERG